MISRLRDAWKNWIKEESAILYSLSWPMLINVIGYAILYGLGTATDTLSSQAYGAKNYRRVGIILQRSLLICSLVLILVIIIFINAESILLILHQSPCIARLTGKFCKIIAIALPALYWAILFLKYLQSQGIVKPGVVTGFVANIINVAGLVVLLYVVKLEIEGAAIAVGSAYYALLISVLFYMFVRKPANKTWQGISWESLKDWGEFLWLGIPGLFLVCSEWWSSEIGSFVTGSVNEVELASYTITIVMATTGYGLPFSIGVAAQIRVGNLLGAAEPDKVKKVTLIAVCFAMDSMISHIVVYGFLAVCLLLGYRNIGELFTSNREVIQVISKITYLMSVNVCTDALRLPLSGVLRGCGKQFIVAVMNFISFYLVGLPLSLVLVYVAKMGALGYWIGIVTADMIQLTIVTILVLRVNFDKESQKARTIARVASEINRQLPAGKESATQQNITDEDEKSCDETTTLIDDNTASSSNNHDGSTHVSDHNGSVTVGAFIKLLLIRMPWFITGLVILGVGVMLS